MKRPRSSSTAFTRISHTPCSSLDSNTSANVAPPPCGTSGWEATHEILDSPRTDVNLAPLGGTGACRSSTTDGCRSTRAHADVLRPSPVALCVRHPPRRDGRQGHSSPGWTTMPKPAAALVLFRLGDRGYATPRDQVLEVVDVGAGQPTVPGLEPSTLAALKAAERLPPLVSLRVALGLPDRGPEGRILVVTTRQGPVGFLVDEVVQVLEIDPTATRVRENRLGSGYVVGTVEALGGTWLLVDWDAIRLPGALRSTR